jgi:phosphomannomutase
MERFETFERKRRIYQRKRRCRNARNCRKEDFNFAEVDDLGKYETKTDAFDIHIQKILDLPMVDAEAVKSKKFKVVLDAVNSTGGISLPPLLEKLGCEVVKLYCEPNGQFPHNPEPLKEHLTDICDLIKKKVQM